MKFVTQFFAPDWRFMQSRESENTTGLLPVSVAILLLLSSPLYADHEKQDSALRPEPALCDVSNISPQQNEYLNSDNNESVGKSAHREPAEHIDVKHYGYRVIKRYPHDAEAFTQGLVFYQQDLYESTGLLGRSSLRKVDLTTGKILKKHKLHARFFGEGLSVVNNQLVQLTWKSGQAFVYDPLTLRSMKEFSYDGEGWGSTVIDNRLIISDGSSTLKIMDAESFKMISTIDVKENQIPVQGLNELEVINGRIFANVWPTDCIAQIDPDNGQVTGWINMSGLYPEDAELKKTTRLKKIAVLNGIAFDEKNDRLFVTGKFWPYLYEIELVESELPIIKSEKWIESEKQALISH